MTEPIHASNYGERVTEHGMNAPRLMVSFRCPYVDPETKAPCGAYRELDAYDGPYVCLGTAETPHRRTFLIAQDLLGSHQ